MDIRLLGDVEVRIGDATVVPERAGERCVLAALAFDPGRTVLIGVLVEYVWGAHPPQKAEETVRTYARTVRRSIERSGGAGELLRNRRPGGYSLDVEPKVVDYRRFVDLTSVARVRSREGDERAAAEAFERALGLWRGEALANLTGDWAAALRRRMRRQRLNATYELLELHLRAGRSEAMATRATELAYADPTDRTVSLALRGLAHSGQRALIPAFMTRVADRMREREARPSAAVVDLARRLATEETPEAPRTKQRSTGAVTMTATNSVNVFQAAGDQYFVE